MIYASYLLELCTADTIITGGSMQGQYHGFQVNKSYNNIYQLTASTLQLEETSLIGNPQYHVYTCWYEATLAPCVWSTVVVPWSISKTSEFYSFFPPFHFPLPPSEFYGGICLLCPNAGHASVGPCVNRQDWKQKPTNKA